MISVIRKKVRMPQAGRAEAAEQAASGAKPLPMTGYKLDLLKGVVQDLLERLAV